jgi:hypothetical protein
VSLTKRELHIWGVHLAAAAALGLLLGFAGPYGTASALGRPVRYAFWLGLTLFGYACVIAASAALGSFADRSPRAGGLRLILAALLSAIPQTLATAWTFTLVQPGRTFAPTQLPDLYLAVAVVQLVIALIAHAVAKRARPVLSAAPHQPAADPHFLQRLPPQLGRDLVALEAEDHYLRVHTSRGSQLVLARMSDAVAQLGGHDGLQVHRSWWVSADAVTAVDVKDGRTVLRLSNGLSAPVSRTYLQAVRARAWTSR